jgi:TorA maturation chaperone TorD
MSLERLARLREGIYRFSGIGFTYPTADVLDAAPAAVPILDDLGLFDFAFALPVVEAAEALANSDLRELEGAYSALFDVGVAGAACSPHLTTYVADPRTGDVATVRAELRATHRRFEIDDRISDPDMVDHVTTQLEVMARLCAKEVRRWARGKDSTVQLSRQHEYFTEHLWPWIPEFTARVATIDRHRAYTMLATALHAFVDHEHDLIAQLRSPMGTGS